MSDELTVEKNGAWCDEGRPLLISGPCSAESEEQVIETARLLKSAGIKIFRAGIWKPRTRPGTFEGMGSIALPWLKRVKQETGMLISTEVASVWHVREAMKHDVDIFWIGARTTANPFAVQEIAEALRGYEMPVFVKNPVNPDIELWIGALQRLNRVGIKQLFAVHRGFSQYGDAPYRNPPQWDIPVEMKRRIPDLPIITDPSHICGSKELLFEVCQTAMDLDFDGLFIESHYKPEEALSDKNQQVTPAELSEILDKLVLRTHDVKSARQLEGLEKYRRQIDLWDNELLRVLKSRMAISEAIGEYKKAENITILQSGRWSELLENRLKKAREMGLGDQFIINLFKQVHQESINFQNRVMN